MITSGAYRGATGEVVQVLTKNDRVVVKGPRIKGVTKHLKPTRINPEGQIISLDRTFHISNVSPVVDGKPTRVRFQTKSDGSKVRVAARNGKDLGVVSPAKKKA
jgi:large subunit ribosomal protein L24